MERTELLDIAKATFDDCAQILDNKNQDYSGDIVDALRNFKLVDTMGLTDVPTGIMVRMCDKFMRISNLLKNPPAVADERIVDTIDDLINYSVILKASLIESGMKVKK